jgi:hypothetical protein
MPALRNQKPGNINSVVIFMCYTNYKYLVLILATLLIAAFAATGCRKCLCCGYALKDYIVCTRDTTDSLTVKNNLKITVSDTDILQRTSDSVKLYTGRGYTCTDSVVVYDEQVYCGSALISIAEANNLVCNSGDSACAP